jgi:hypothetical protein
VIRDLSTTLRAILDDPALQFDFPELFGAHVLFERPDSTFAPQAPATIDLFLYEVRENAELRDNEERVEHVNGRALVRKAPKRFDCSYLVTAWPVSGADLALQEHRLLGQALQVLSRYPTLPEAFLQGSLAGQEPAPPMVAAQMDGLQSPAEFWTAMGNQVRAAFTVTATIAVPVLPDVDGPLVTTLIEGFGVGDTALAQETLYQIGGRVLDGAGGGIASATVDLVKDGRTLLRARTDAEGRYRLPRVAAGPNDLHVVAVGFQPLDASIAVPGRTEDYELTLAPL